MNLCKRYCSAKFVAPFVLLLALGACGVSSTEKAATGSKATAQEAAAVLSVLDFRAEELRMAKTPPEASEASSVKEVVYGSGYSSNLHTGEPLAGAFTDSEKVQRVYLLTRKDTRTAMLAVFDETDETGASETKPLGELAGQLVLTEPYHSIAASFDLGNDGTAELALIQYDFQMGVHIASLDIYSLADMQLELLRTQEFVLQDGCSSAWPDRSIRASRVQFSHSGMAVEEFMSPCARTADELPQFKPLN
ncbi:MAG: hypothetical protein KTR32_33460 [Granulosicoccus sp.]|nr:hypothetical protein [Granulosicoccus sp.]